MHQEALCGCLSNFKKLSVDAVKQLKDYAWLEKKAYTSLFR